MHAAITAALVVVGVLIAIFVIRRSEQPKPPSCPNVAGNWKKSDDNYPFKISVAPTTDPNKICQVLIEWKPGDITQGWVSKTDPKGLIWFFDVKNPTVATRGELSADGTKITLNRGTAFYIRT